MPDCSKKPYKSRKDSFYNSLEWKIARYAVIRANQGRCECCGMSAKHGKVLHVDHIKPRSRHPELEIKADNLQVLCEDCNLGKINSDSINWKEEVRFSTEQHTRFVIKVQQRIKRLKKSRKVYVPNKAERELAKSIKAHKLKKELGFVPRYVLRKEEVQPKTL